MAFIPFILKDLHAQQIYEVMMATIFTLTPPVPGPTEQLPHNCECVMDYCIFSNKPLLQGLLSLMGSDIHLFVLAKCKRECLNLPFFPAYFKTWRPDQSSRSSDTDGCWYYWLVWFSSLQVGWKGIVANHLCKNTLEIPPPYTQKARHKEGFYQLVCRMQRIIWPITDAWNPTLVICTFSLWTHKPFIVMFWIMLCIILISNIVQQATLHVSKHHYIFPYFTHTKPTSHYLGVLQRQSHDFIIVSPLSFQLHHLHETIQATWLSADHMIHIRIQIRSHSPSPYLTYHILCFISEFSVDIPQPSIIIITCWKWANALHCMLLILLWMLVSQAVVWCSNNFCVYITSTAFFPSHVTKSELLKSLK